MFRPSHVVVGTLVLMAAACSDSDNVVHTLNAATVRLVNDTDTPLSLVNAGIIDPVNSALVFGQASACVLVDLTNTPTITITNVAGATIAFTPILSAGDNVTVVAFAATVGNVATGTVQFATLNNRFVPALNGAGLRFFNGVSTTGPLVMRRNGLVLTPFVGFGAASGFEVVDARDSGPAVLIPTPAWRHRHLDMPTLPTFTLTTAHAPRSIADLVRAGEVSVSSRHSGVLICGASVA